MEINEFAIIGANACPQDCSTTYLPVDVVDPDCIGEVPLSEINGLVIGFNKVASQLTDWGLGTDWTTAIDNTDTAGTKMKALPLRNGAMPAGDPKEILAYNQKNKRIYENFTITAEVLVTSDVLYNFFRSMQCNAGNSIYFYYTDISKKVYGKLQDDTSPISEGIKGTMTVDLPHVAGEDGYAVATLTIKYKASTNPNRTDFPIDIFGE